MAAVFPGSVRVFTAKVDLIDTVMASHVNLLQDEVTAVETTLGTGLLASSWAGSYTTPSMHATLTARLTNIEAGLKSATGVHGLSGSVVGTTDTQTLTNKTISGTSNTLTNIPQSSITGIPTNVVGTTDTQTLTNKTMSGTSNTFSNIPQSAVTDLSSDLASKAPLSIPINAQTGSTYTLVIGDAGKQIEMSNASANTVVVPPNSSVALPVGTTVLVLQSGAGQTTISAGSGVTVNSTPGLKLRAQWSAATLIKRATDTWVLTGDTSA